MSTNWSIHVNNAVGHNEASGDFAHPVETADEAFRRIPPYWDGSAEIIFFPTGRNYPVRTGAVSFGTPVGPDASPLVLRGGYTSVMGVTAVEGSSLNEIVTTSAFLPDQLVGFVLQRSNEFDPYLGPAISIRGNTASKIFPQRPLDTISVGDFFDIQRPSVTLAPTQTLNLTSHDGRSPNLAMIGIKIEPAPSAGLNLLNVRALCDTCEFSLPSGGNIHSGSLIFGGFKPEEMLPGMDPQRSQAGVYIHGPEATPLQLLSVVREGVLGGHLTLRKINVRVSQGGWLVPQSLEALGAPINIAAGGSAFGAWGVEFNKARIRNVTTGDGLRLSNGGSLDSPLGPIYLDISSCSRDAIRLDMGSWASFGTPGGSSGLTGGGNLRGMNVRNGSRAFVGLGAVLSGSAGDVALDDIAVPDGWMKVSADSPSPGRTQSLVRLSLS